MRMSSFIAASLPVCLGAAWRSATFCVYTRPVVADKKLCLHLEIWHEVWRMGLGAVLIVFFLDGGVSREGVEREMRRVFFFSRV